MSRTLPLVLILLLLGPALASAHSVAPSEALPLRTSADAEPQSFDALVAGAKMSMMANPRLALQKAHIASDFARGQLGAEGGSKMLATSLGLEAEALTRMNRLDEARPLLNRAIQLANEDGRPSKLDGDLALSLARFAESSGDVGLALRSLHKAHDIFASLGEARSQAMALQALGSIYDAAHDFSREIEYYRRASQIFSGDPALELSAANNIGVALRQLGRYDEAIKDLRRALAIAVSLKSSFLRARILTNLASVYAKSHRFDESEAAANDALRLLGRDENGWAPFVWGAKAELEYESGGIDDAATDLDRAFRGIDIATTISPFRDIHEIAYKVYRAKGDYNLALAHLEAFKRLDDEGRSLSASANLAVTGARFNFANQQLEIEHLRSEQLRRDISLRESRAATESAIFAGLLLISILLMVWVSWRSISARRHRHAITQANVALRKTLTERDSEIARRTMVEAQLRQAKEAAEAANRAKSHFLATMSHELRTPLNAIIGFSEIMSTEALGAVGNGTYKGYASDIHASGRHLLAILNDILDMASIDSGKVAAAEDEVILSRVVESSLRVFANELSGPKTIRFIDRYPGLRVRGDERMLGQILINLISNALKFTAENGVVEVAVERVEGGVDLIVRDNGIGIPQDKLALVMEPFGQAAGPYARSHGGIGLGLSIVKSLVDLHGGVLTLSSEVDEGTVARVHLPPGRVLYAQELNRPALAS